MRDQITRVIGVTFRRGRRETHRFLEMLLGERVLVCRALRDGKVDEQDRILRNNRKCAMKIIERAVEIAVGHERVYVILFCEAPLKRRATAVRAVVTRDRNSWSSTRGSPSL